MLILQHNLLLMSILGQIIGIVILVLVIFLVVGIIRYAIRFDFNAPIFKIDITITDKKEDES